MDALLQPVAGTGNGREIPQGGTAARSQPGVAARGQAQSSSGSQVLLLGVVTFVL